jgi:hypothetical protein
MRNFDNKQLYGLKIYILVKDARGCYTYKTILPDFSIEDWNYIVLLCISDGDSWNILGDSSGLSKNKFGCDMCGKSFSTRAILQRHKMGHTGEKPYQCRYCEYATAQKCNLKRHMMSKHFDIIQECQDV